MTLNREELQQLKKLLDKICNGQKDCAHCPMGFTSKKRGDPLCFEDRILERVEIRTRIKEKETNDR